MLQWLGALVALLVGLAGAAYAYFVTYEPDRSRYPVRGIDVSHHQGEIEWAKVAADDVTFAYIKATEGGDFRDKAFARNWSEARKAGIATGAYHFYTFCRPAADQAQNIIATVPKEADALPLVIDLEFGGNCAAAPEAPHLKAEITLLLERVEAHFGQTAILYVTKEFQIAYGATCRIGVCGSALSCSRHAKVNAGPSGSSTIAARWMASRRLWISTCSLE